MASILKQKLIAAVRDRPVIWDAAQKGHLNRFVLDRYWSEVSALVGISASDASKMWKNVRQEFKKQLEKAKEKQAEDPNSDELLCTWPYFNSLLFLVDQFDPAKKKKSLSYIISEYDENAKTEPNGNEDSQGETNMSSISTSANVPHFSMQAVENRANTPSISTSAHMSMGTQVAENGLVNLKKRKLEQQYYTERDMDEDIGFFNSLLPHVKKLQAKKKLQFRMKMQKMLYDFLYEDKNGNNDDLTGDASSSSPPPVNYLMSPSMAASPSEVHVKSEPIECLSVETDDVTCVQNN